MGGRPHAPFAIGHLLLAAGRSARGGWLGRIGIALVAALFTGALTFLAARGIGAVALFVQQQQLLREVAGALGGGIEGLASNDLRAIRRELQRIDAWYELLSLLAAAAVATLTVAAVYLRLERNVR